MLTKGFREVEIVVASKIFFVLRLWESEIFNCHRFCDKIKFELGISQIFEFSTIVHKLFLNLYLSLPFLINLRVKENLREQGLLHF